MLAAVPVQPFTVMFTLYMPASADVAFIIVGFCAADVKPLGPVHAYVAPATVAAVRFIVLPVHTGLLPPAAGDNGVWFTTTVVVLAAVPVQPFTVMLTLYVPASADVAFVIVGFCVADVKLLGPVHAYVAPATVAAVRFIVLPVHTGLLLDAAGGKGV